MQSAPGHGSSDHESKSTFDLLVLMAGFVMWFASCFGGLCCYVNIKEEDPSEAEVLHEIVSGGVCVCFTFISFSLLQRACWQEVMSEVERGMTLKKVRVELLI